MNLRAALGLLAAALAFELLVGLGVWQLERRVEKHALIARVEARIGERPVELPPRDLEICAAVGPYLKERGLIFVGIDVIGDYLTEINVTSPTGLQEVARFDNVFLEKQIWEAIEARVTPR